jgi:hypothetical protein
MKTVSEAGLTSRILIFGNADCPAVAQGRRLDEILSTVLVGQLCVDQEARSARMRTSQWLGKPSLALADYIAKKYQPGRNRRDIDDIDCADVLSIYLSDVGEPADQFEIITRIGRLNEYWGGKTLSAVNAQTCGGYVKHRGNQGGARRHWAKRPARFGV